MRLPQGERQPSGAYGTPRAVNHAIQGCCGVGHGGHPGARGECVFVALPGPPGGAVAHRRRAGRLPGGSCNNSQMTTVPCTNPNQDCLNTSLICVPVKGKGVCWRWEPNPQGACTGMEGWNCTCTSQTEGCAKQYEGQLVSGGCKQCDAPRGTCGIVKTVCTSGPCEQD